MMFKIFIIPKTFSINIPPSHSVKETKSGCEKQFSLETIQKIAKAPGIDAKELFNKIDNKNIF